jgi:5'-3' exonuclease
MLASLFMSIGNHTNIEVDENLIRHMFLNSLRANRKKFHGDFGEVVICADGKSSWRKEIFAYYKAGRRKSREESELDWNELFRIINLIRTELDEVFPYKVIHIDHCEADDIIGTIVHHLGTELNTGSEKILVLSGDKDYIQLHRYANVSQYDPVRKKWIQNSNPDLYLKEHILKGDNSDGVPNVLSSDNSFVVGERQKAMTAKRMSQLLNGTSEMDELTKIRYYRNKMMIDLSEVPQKYKDKIMEEFLKEKTIGRSSLFNYFIEKRLKNLLTDIQDF